MTLFLHPMAAETALAMVNLEVGLDYWLPGDAHQELQRVQDGLDLWKSRGVSGGCPSYLHC